MMPPNIREFGKDEALGQYKIFGTLEKITSRIFIEKNTPHNDKMIDIIIHFKTHRMCDIELILMNTMNWR